MNHRVFIAINLPENIKNKISDYEKEWYDMPCRWTKRENLHITLAFLGSLTDEDVLEVCNIAKEVAAKHAPFIIELNKILYGPPGKPPRMIWVEGKESEDLGKLQTDLENSINKLSAESENKKGQPYSPHITLGRLKQWEFQKLELEERPEVNEDISLNFQVKSLEVMESELKKKGPEYAILESLPLGSDKI
ncbi:MAG: RNA 2',3'-cyclic phosphodiesterase [Candidatus Pacebacteria bacterium]|nr:RNA 2',3'-cyclic phosphodiesterase [Candidatus Paceibacterota bacterium]